MPVQYTPPGWRHGLFTVGGELLFAHRKVSNTTESGADDGSVTEPQKRRFRQEPGETSFETRDSYGYYLWADVQPWRQWLLGLRYDWTDFPNGPAMPPGRSAW